MCSEVTRVDVMSAKLSNGIVHSSHTTKVQQYATANGEIGPCLYCSGMASKMLQRRTVKRRGKAQLDNAAAKRAGQSPSSTGYFLQCTGGRKGRKKLQWSRAQLRSLRMGRARCITYSICFESVLETIA